MEEWYDEIVVGAEEIELEEIIKLSYNDARQILINTFDSARVLLSNDEDEVPGWTVILCGMNGDDMIAYKMEDKLDALLEILTGEVSENPDSLSHKFSTKAANANNKKCVIGSRTNLYFFFYESNAQEYLKELRNQANAFKIKTEIEGEV